MSDGDGNGPCAAQPAPAAYEEAGPGTFQPVGGPASPGKLDPRIFAALLGLLGLSAAVALAVPSPAQACAPADPALTGPAPARSATPGPTAPATACTTPTPVPNRISGLEAGKPLPRTPAQPGQPLVAAAPSKLTGSTVTMTGLRFDGIVDLPTADGTLTALKFTMDRAVTHDVLLRVPGPAGRTMHFATNRLTVQGSVALYATRFAGRLLDIEITLAPELPFPDSLLITSSTPITFTEPAIDLAFIASDTLTARPMLKLSLR